MNAYPLTVTEQHGHAQKPASPHLWRFYRDPATKIFSRAARGDGLQGNPRKLALRGCTCRDLDLMSNGLETGYEEANSTPSFQADRSLWNLSLPHFQIPLFFVVLFV